MFRSKILSDSVSADCIEVSFNVISMFMFDYDSESVLSLVVILDVVSDYCKLLFFGFFGILNFVEISRGCYFDLDELVLCSCGSASVS